MLVNRNAIVPVTREQIRNIEESGFSDTSLVYIGERDNVFVFIIKEGEKNINKLADDKSGLLIVRITGVSAAQKLYLEKRARIFFTRKKGNGVHGYSGINRRCQHRCSRRFSLCEIQDKIKLTAISPAACGQN